MRRIVLGILRSVASGIGFVVFGALILWGFVAEDTDATAVAHDYRWPYLLAGVISIALVLFAIRAYPRFEAPHAQRRDVVLKRRYWLYYALVFIGGARRQIFLVFATFMLVEKFGYAVHEMAALLLLNHFVTMLAAPFIGRLLAHYGERLAMTIEYLGLMIVFTGYAVLYYADAAPVWAAVLYIADHIFFAMAFAQKTYFQKIADPEDHAPTAAVAFTINHIAAVFLPAMLGYLYLVQPAWVFLLGALLASVSLGLAQSGPARSAGGAGDGLGARHARCCGVTLDPPFNSRQVSRETRITRHESPDAQGHLYRT